MSAHRSIWILICWLGIAWNFGFTQTERKVTGPARLDWEFAVSGFGKGSAKLPAGYDSTKQKYQLYAPTGAKKDKPAALVLFVSAGDTPQGWKNWQPYCEKEGVFFASPFGAGNNTAAG